ncbi:family 88 glycosyl hydrolase [Siphonobacter sp. SORGH_AS_0500]|uniref:glycoside hydrolase family 88/105 protein n=1 Tax=Siphonobacter sp. SORGH_AS_0500 TaxID=1864824 RepID=UPI000CB9969E|nr:glycoside hydrolase family 88 protein [Siphonobacter sp. SORGH_AS_0500]PKK35471.1 family 88 glycosyl hydrolase [Siphonobacter sp. SORGH_AS_0500]
MMKKRFLATIGLFALSISVQAQKLSKTKDILEPMQRANAYFMQKWPDTGKEIVTNIARPSNIWTRAVYYEGLLALHEIDKKKEYLDYAYAWGESHKWGLRGGIKTRNADNQCCGQTYLALYEMNPSKKECMHDIKASIDSMMATSKVNDWTWIDAIQMAMPVFAKLGQLTNNPAYYERMYEMYKHSKDVEGGKGLYNPQDKLWWRDKDFVPPYKEPNGEDCYWSRGNGWVVAAMVRVLQIIPKNAPHREDYQKMLVDMLSVLPKIQRTDGFWNASLHDPTNYGGKEATGTALFVYGMAWGINQGIIPAKTYRPVVLKAWNALVKESVQPNGFLGYVQGTGKEPKDGQPVTVSSKPDFEDYGLGCFLLAGSEVYKMK